MSTATLLSVNVGLPQDVAWGGRTVHTGVVKHAVAGPRLVRRLNVDGDGQGDLAGHGGEQRAVLVYQIDSYRHWQRHFGRDDFRYGQFGENFTVDGLPDAEVHIGDRYRIGTAEFEVTQPRVTCFRVGMRLGEPELPALLVSHHRPGFYLRVLTEGTVAAGDQIVRTATGRHRLAVTEADALLYLPHRDVGRLRAAVDIPALSPGWQQSFADLLAEHTPGRDGSPVAAPPVGVEPGWPGFRRLRVVDVVPETPTVTSVLLAGEPGERLPRPQAGQYLTLRLADAGEPAPVRSYSLSSAPDAADYRISVKREPGGLVSGYLHERLRAGARVEVAAPRGEFVLAAGERPVLLVSAGIGVTPVLAMLHQLAGEHADREVWWIHVARNARQHAFAAEAHRLLAALPRAHERVWLTSPDERPLAGRGTLHRGRPGRAELAGLGLPVDADAYLCGPEAFMAAMDEALGGLGIAPQRVHTELFGTLAPINPGVVGSDRPAPHQPERPGTGPRVTFARSGLSTGWSDARRSLLELAEACDVPTRWSCRTGVCHTCVTGLLSGSVDYAPEPLEPPGAGRALLCCSRPDQDVVLDL